MEINEEIVREYFSVVKQCFIRENVLFKVETYRDKKKGGGWSDIDLLAYSPVENKIFDIEIKYRAKAPFHRGNDKASNLDKVIKDFKLPERIAYLKNLNTQKLPIQKTFITNKKAFSNKRRAEYEESLENDVIELLYFEEVIAKLQEHYRDNPDKLISIRGQRLRIINNQEKESST